MVEAGFLADFADGGLFRGFAGLDVALRNRPAVFRILDQENLNVVLGFVEAKNDAAGGWFANDFLNAGALMENRIAEARKRGFLMLKRNRFRNLSAGLAIGRRRRSIVRGAFSGGALRSRRGGASLRSRRRSVSGSSARRSRRWPLRRRWPARLRPLRRRPSCPRWTRRRPVRRPVRPSCPSWIWIFVHEIPFYYLRQ